MRERTYIGDTALIQANLFAEDGVNTLGASEVAWKIKKPDGEIVSGGPAAIESTEATIAFTDTNLPGDYHGQITFTLTDDDTTKRSTVLDFEVVDPLETTGPEMDDTTRSNPDRVTDRAWMKLEDLFDSELGGPHVRDRTLANFDRTKLKRFLPDALYNINNYYQPSTGFDDTSFPYAQHSPLLSQALLVEALYHLQRSYVEQPTPMGPGTPSYFDRRDYMNRWNTVLVQEENRLNVWLDLFKRGEMGFGQGSLLVGGYASYTNRYPRYMRGRYPYIYRW